MKRFLIAATSLCLAASAASAQNMYDAMNFSQNLYYGTARTMALSNAVTAVGGDLGTIGINPAGSAVAGYSQVSITPGLTISSVGASYSPVGDKYYGAPVNSSMTRFTLPNLGVSFDFKTGYDTGVRNFTVAVVSNVTNSFSNRFNSYGSNSRTSAFAELAEAAGSGGYSYRALDDYQSYNDTDIPWDLITGFRSNTFSVRDNLTTYMGNTEVFSSDNKYIYVPGTLNQNVEVQRMGYKADVVLNLGINVSDFFYAGLNVGFPTMRYRYDEFYSEAPQDPEQFPIVFLNDDLEYETTYARKLTKSYSYSNATNGVYGKLGVIVLPTTNLRLGLAFQSPSAYTVNESWSYAASSTYATSSFNGSASSPAGEYSYRLRTPYILDAGAAYTLGPYGFISVDYELMDYSIMAFSTIYSDSWSQSAFSQLNEVNRKFCGVSHNFRIGVEARVGSFLSVRAGYSLLTTPEKYGLDEYGNTVTASDYLGDPDWYRSSIRSFSFYKDLTQGFSLGFGYSSKGSFYADFAARLRTFPVAIYTPYYDYTHYDASGERYNGIGDDTESSPYVSCKRKLIDLALTIGWRF